MKGSTAGRLLRLGAISAVLVVMFCRSDAGVRYDPASKIFRLDAGGITYAFGVNEKDMLQSLYWGAQLSTSDKFKAVLPAKLADIDPSTSIVAQEYPGWGGTIYTEPTLKVAYPNGVRDVVLRYQSYKISGNTLTVELSDIKRPLHVALRYTIDEETGMIGRSAAIRNDDNTDIRIDQASSAAWSLPVGADYRLHYLTGRYGAEWTLQERRIDPGATVIESRRGSTSHGANPWFAIDREGVSTEESGQVWFGVLAWSGSWQIRVDRNPRGDVRIVGGFNPFDFSYRLKPGESLETPVFYGGFSNHGMGGASRLLHRFERAHILPGAPKPKLRPVLYNSWEATEFAVNEKDQMALAEKAAKIGVERFVMDDGWFGARNTDHAGLGDWVVNKEKFPHGLKPLIDKVHQLGMEFGLWVEPEMVNPDSDLYRQHPDWVINMTGRPRSEARNQLVLDLARKDVRDYVLAAVDNLVSQNDIQFLKWDYNRSWSEPGQPDEDPADQQKLYVDYSHNLYGILAEIRRRHPKLEIESCAGGGGRVDLGIMAYTDEVWPSDNTDPYDRLAIQNGFTHAYSPAIMMAWVTDSPNWVNRRATSLAYRFLSSMQGGLGVGANLNKWDAADFSTATKMIAAYKQIRATVQQGNLYRLIPAEDEFGRTATFYVSQDARQGVLFAFLHSSTELTVLPTFRVSGLDPHRNYRVSEVGTTPTTDAEVRSGAYWMNVGIDIPLVGDFQAKAYIFEAIN